MTTEAIDRRSTFTVAAHLASVRGSGTLRITPESIVLEPDSVTSRLSRTDRIVHTGRSVRFVKARLMPPWCDTALVLQGEKASGSAVTRIGARKRLRAELRAAGFHVQDVTTWFSLTGGATSAGLAWNPRARILIALAAVITTAVAVLLISHSLLFIALAAACLALTLFPLLRR